MKNEDDVSEQFVDFVEGRAKGAVAEWGSKNTEVQDVEFEALGFEAASVFVSFTGSLHGLQPVTTAAGVEVAVTMIDDDGNLYVELDKAAVEDVLN